MQLYEREQSPQMGKKSKWTTFGQLPWSLKNPDGTHLDLGRGQGWRKRQGREYAQAGTHLRKGKASRMITN